MGATSAPVFPFPGGTQGAEPADPVAGKPGHFAWSRWIKEYVRRLNVESVKISGDTMTGDLTLKRGAPTGVTLSNPSSGHLAVSGTVSGSDPVQNSHFTTRQYVDNRVPLYFETTLNSDGTGWATPNGLKTGAVVFSLVDVSNTPTTTQLMLNPATNQIYIGPSTSRTVRIWYV